MTIAVQKAVTLAKPVSYVVIPQQPDADMMTLIGMLFDTAGAPATPGDVIVTDARFTSQVIRAADWPTYATPSQ